jgi:predicted 3-demethylubiquinone-9 3-methyltransferase (glyoxalase superfamily)
MQKIVTFLWFDKDAEAAMNFYCSVFKHAKPGRVSRQGPDGPVFSVEFELEGQQFYALNGGPMYSFTPAISVFVNCEGQAEVDELWGKLVAGGSEQPCGWLKDQFGLSWQVIPSALGKLMRDPNPKKSGAVVQALMQMKKIDISALQKAYDAA